MPTSTSRWRKPDVRFRLQDHSVALLLASWTLIFQLAKRGIQIPVLAGYGRIFKTHRIFRQYVYSAGLAIAAPTLNVYSQFQNHVETCYQIHAQRLNRHILCDPDGTDYPESLVGEKKINFARIL